MELRCALAPAGGCDLQQHNLTKLAPIFDYVAGDHSPPPAPKHTSAPSKPRAPRKSAAANRAAAAAAAAAAVAASESMKVDLVEWLGDPCCAEVEQLSWTLKLPPQPPRQPLRRHGFHSPPPAPKHTSAPSKPRAPRKSAAANRAAAAAAAAAAVADVVAFRKLAAFRKWDPSSCEHCLSVI
jgi:ferric-dicitrate binding protein FerR (iron transport regulator)